MDTDEDQGTDTRAAALDIAVPTGVHPIKALEALIKSHIGHTTTLAGHVADIAGSTSAAAKQATAAVKRAEDVLAKLGEFADQVDQHFAEIERKIAALQPPAISGDLETAAKGLDQAVADVKAAVPAAAPEPTAYPPGEENAANS